MSGIQFLLAIAIIVNAGGEGKTTLAILIDALLDLLGRQVELVDVDEGNGSLSYSRASARNMGWGMGPRMAGQVYKDLAGTNIVYDFGANCMASGANVVGLFWAIDELLKNGGYDRIAFVPISNNKPGAAGAATAVAEALYARGLRPIFVRVNRGGSHGFEGTLAGFSIVELDYLDTGYMEHIQRMQKTRPLADLIRNPEPGYELAMQYIVHWLRRFASQPVVVQLLGQDVGPVLDKLGYTTPPYNKFVHLREERITTASLRQLIERTKAVPN